MFVMITVPLCRFKIFHKNKTLLCIMCVQHLGGKSLVHLGRGGEGEGEGEGEGGGGGGGGRGRGRGRGGGRLRWRRKRGRDS